MSEKLAKYGINNGKYFINFDHIRHVIADNAVVLPICDKEREWIISTTIEQINDYVSRVLYYNP